MALRRARRLAALAGGLGAAVLALPAAAPAADCPLPGSADPSFTGVALDVQGDVSSARTGGYLQIPFDVPAGTTAIRVRYSYDQPGDVCSFPGGNKNTLDIGVYEPKGQGESTWDDPRGWSGSAVRDLAISENRFTPDAVYDADRKAFVHGYTTRAYRPGPIPAGQWAVELGIAYVDPDAVPADQDVHYRVRVETSSSSDWSDDPWQPEQSSGAVVDPDPGWYSGDLHVHGEMEPGNATMRQTFAAAFDPPGSGGAGLDFVTLVDHNNDIAHADLGTFQAENPDHLIIGGVEVTTYRGHYNDQGTDSPVADYRTGPIWFGDPAGGTIGNGDLVERRGPTPPSDGFAEIEAGGGWTQINHPSIFKSAPGFCRGCAWSYSDADTDFPLVDAIEVQTGPAAIGGVAFNPFTPDAIDYYEHALDSGAHIAAVGSSDDHQGGAGSGPTYSPVGSATTMVHASELSERAIIAAVKADHTYVKLFGNSGPEITLTARGQGGERAIIGDSLKAPQARFTATVDGAESTGRPGAWKLLVLRDGEPIETVPFSGDSFTHSFTAEETGRYALETIREQPGQGGAVTPMIENYSSPIWFRHAKPKPPKPPSNRFRIVARKRNPKKGTARLTIRVPGPGSLRLSGRSVRTVKRQPARAGRVKVTVRPWGKLRAKLRRDGHATARLRLAYRPTGGERRVKTPRVFLRLKGAGGPAGAQPPPGSACRC